MENKNITSEKLRKYPKVERISRIDFEKCKIECVVTSFLDASVEFFIYVESKLNRSCEN